jgi:parallel beta-helix repeat protein
VHHNGQTDFDHGLYISGFSNLIEGNDIHHNAGWGIHFYNGSDSASIHDNIIRNNISHDNATAGGRGAGILVHSGNNNAIYNNISYNNADGIQIGGSNNKVYNNTVYKNRGRGIVYYNSTGTDIRNNIVYANGDTVVDDGGNSGATVKNNLVSNPLFVNPGLGDFHLQAGSPAIDGGLALSAVATDYAGTPRPQGAGYDIGAYEYGSPTLPAPTNFRIAQQ